MMEFKSKIMVKIIYEPWKTLVIHDCTQYSLEDLKNLSNILSQGFGGVIALSWANGILLSVTPVDGKWVDDEKKEGRIHWENVSFAEMSKFQNHLTTSMGNIPIIDFSKHPLYNALSKWIKKKTAE